MRCLALILLAACHGAAATPAAPRVASTSPAPAAARFGDAPPVMTPGERMTYRVQLQGLELASMTLGVGEVTELGGKRVVVVQGHAKSVGLANMVAAVDDTFTSWIDPRTGRSQRFAVDEYRSNSKTDVEHTIADLAAHTATSLPITFALNDAPPAPEPQTLAQPDPWDYNAFLIALRGWEAPVGTRQVVEVLRSRWLWNIEVVVGGKETLHTDLGDLPALRFDAVTFRLDRAGKRDPGSEQRTFSVWISDDAGRVPLLTAARTDYGDIRIEIAEYTPGT